MPELPKDDEFEAGFSTVQKERGPTVVREYRRAANGMLIRRTHEITQDGEVIKRAAGIVKKGQGAGNA